MKNGIANAKQDKTPGSGRLQRLVRSVLRWRTWPIYFLSFRNGHLGWQIGEDCPKRVTSLVILDPLSGIPRPINLPSIVAYQNVFEREDDFAVLR